MICDLLRDFVTGWLLFLVFAAGLGLGMAGGLVGMGLWQVKRDRSGGK